MSMKQERVLWPMIALIVLALTTAAFVTRSKRTMASPKGDSESTAQKPSSAVAPNVPPGAVQMVRFTVYEAGIRPNIVRASPGLVEIHIEDPAGISEGLVVQNASGLALGQAMRAQGRWRGSVRMRLEPGNYRIYDATRPRNSATLIVKQ